MNHKSFINISKKECLLVYKEILENSNSKWHASQKLAEINELGSATSLSIISIEELIKALILLFDGHGFEIRNIKGVDTLFKNHQIRYFLAFGMSLINIFGNEVINLLNHLIHNPNEIKRISDLLKNDNDYILKKLNYYFLRKLIVIKIELEWFSQIDILRQDGFYCDYEDYLKTPLKITPENYNDIIIRLNKVREIGHTIIEMFEKEDTFTLIEVNKIRRTFKSENYYKKLESQLDKFRRTRKTPFEEIQNYFFK